MLSQLRVHTIAVIFLMLSGTAFAQATRTWVSGVGDDANPCSRTAPCKTFAGAISKTAAGGIISVLDPGGFGGVTITKAITLDGGGIEGSVLVSGTNGIIVQALATDKVTIRNLSIYGLGTGINGVNIVSGGHITIERCIISGFTNAGINANAPNSQVYVYDSLVQGNPGASAFGMLVNQGSATVERVKFQSNGADGFRVNGAGARASVQRSSSSGHTAGWGFSAVGGFLTVNDSAVSNNAFGIGTNNASVSVGSTSVVNTTNTALWACCGGQLLSFGNNTLSFNGSNGGFTGSLAHQ